jgi:hypothetical protein
MRQTEERTSLKMSEQGGFPCSIIILLRLRDRCWPDGRSLSSGHWRAVCHCGGAIGAAAVRRADDTYRKAALPNTGQSRARFLNLSVVFTLTMLVLGLLTWGIYVEANLQSSPFWFSLNDLSGSLCDDVAQSLSL